METLNCFGAFPKAPPGRLFQLARLMRGLILYVGEAGEDLRDVMVEERLPEWGLIFCKGYHRGCYFNCIRSGLSVQHFLGVWGRGHRVAGMQGVFNCEQYCYYHSTSPRAENEVNTLAHHVPAQICKTIR